MPIWHKMYKFIIFILTTSLAYTKTLTMQVEDKSLRFEAQTVEGINFINFKQSALAYKALKAPRPKLKSKQLAGNPASRNCKLLNGKSVILRDSKNRQYDYCKFRDESMIDSWGLYESH
ncbi:MAG: hypothetical protein CME67_07370 [Halobacteriovoraceae bacterium]|nr:hypothetical protein [Halobacteriovoraceae bacterium]|tara:strand:+ start:704 stop:1060 length:357 start_codon:yes stop_codon:yes gene_type:complete